MADVAWCTTNNDLIPLLVVIVLVLLAIYLLLKLTHKA